MAKMGKTDNKVLTSMLNNQYVINFGLGCPQSMELFTKVDIYILRGLIIFLVSVSQMIPTIH